jgi:hypothetical protein
MLDVNWNPSRRDLRQFGAIWFPLFAAIVGVTVLRRTGSWPMASAAWSLGALGLVVGLATPARLKPIFVGWMVLAFPIGWVMSLVFLGLTYFAVFTIVALAMRLARYDPLARRWSPSATTYWTPTEDRTPAADYFRQF